MAGKQRGKGRKSRENLYRQPSVGQFLIAVDTECTEKYYLQGLQKEINQSEQNISIEFLRAKKTDDLIDVVIENNNENVHFKNIWLIFDRDKFKNFDNIINEADERGIKVAWSNPCIETWFSAYLDNIQTYSDSQIQNRHFKTLFKNKTGKEYKKSDKKIYEILNKYGDENKAIERAKNKLAPYLNDQDLKPSELIGCTTFYQLVEELNKYRN